MSVSPTQLFFWHAFVIAVTVAIALGFVFCMYLTFKFMRGIFRKVTR
jgi:hypothetical protein